MNSKGDPHKRKTHTLNLLLEVRYGISYKGESRDTLILWSFTPVLLSVSGTVGAEKVEEGNVAFCDIVCSLETSLEITRERLGKGWHKRP